jgi:hypothetical protein
VNIVKINLEGNENMSKINLTNQTTQEQKFWKDLKKCLLDEYIRNEYLDAPAYYKLAEESEEMQNIAKQSIISKYDIAYIIDELGYSNGQINIKFTNLNYIYIIELCSSISTLEEDIFNNGIIPSIAIKQIKEIYYNSFEDRDDEYISAQEEWKDELKIYQDEKILKQINDKLSRIEELKAEIIALQKEIA